MKNACSELKRPLRPRNVPKHRGGDGKGAITDKRSNRTVCECEQPLLLMGRTMERHDRRWIESRYIYNDPICMQMAAYRMLLSLSHCSPRYVCVYVSHMCEREKERGTETKGESQIHAFYPLCLSLSSTLSESMNTYVPHVHVCCSRVCNYERVEVANRGMEIHRLCVNATEHNSREKPRRNFVVN